MVSNHQSYYDLDAVSGFKPHTMFLFHDEAELLSLLYKYPNANVLMDGKLEDSLTQSTIATLNKFNCTIITSAFPKIISEKTKIPYQALYSCKK